MAASVLAPAEKVTVKWTLGEFLSFEETAKRKHQLLAGRIYSMAGGTDTHSEIAANLISEVHLRLRGTSCRVLTSDMLVRIDEYSAVYPDMSVVCGKRQFADDNRLALLNPTVVVEVTSPSSLADDRGWKLASYQSLPSLRACLIIDQHRIYAELHTRLDAGWQQESFASLDAVIPVEALAIELPMARVYADVAGELARN